MFSIVGHQLKKGDGNATVCVLRRGASRQTCKTVTGKDKVMDQITIKYTKFYILSLLVFNIEICNFNKKKLTPKMFKISPKL